MKSKIVPKFSLQILISTLYYNTNCNYGVYCFVIQLQYLFIFTVFVFVFTEFMVLFLFCLNKRELFNESYCISGKFSILIGSYIFFTKFWSLSFKKVF